MTVTAFCFPPHTADKQLFQNDSCNQNFRHPWGAQRKTNYYTSEIWKWIKLNDDAFVLSCKQSEVFCSLLLLSSADKWQSIRSPAAAWITANQFPPVWKLCSELNWKLASLTVTKLFLYVRWSLNWKNNQWTIMMSSFFKLFKVRLDSIKCWILIWGLFDYLLLLLFSSES